MSPVSQPDGHDAPWLINDSVPGLAAQVEELVIGGEDAVGEEIVAHELPEVFDRGRVEAMVTHRPPHRSQRAAFPHWAPPPGYPTPSLGW